eukprot:scaffold154333_cov36-Tisochrysis_lutea.AAC.5
MYLPRHHLLVILLLKIKFVHILAAHAALGHGVHRRGEEREDERIEGAGVSHPEYFSYSMRINADAVLLSM